MFSRRLLPLALVLILDALDPDLASSLMIDSHFTEPAVIPADGSTGAFLQPRLFIRGRRAGLRGAFASDRHESLPTGRRLNHV